MAPFTAAEHTADPVRALTTLEPRQGLDKGDHDHGRDKEDEMWTFCDSWSTAGSVTSLIRMKGVARLTASDVGLGRYAGLLSVTFGVGALFANVLVMISRRVKHRGGWRIVTILAALHGAWMLVAVALVAYEFNHDDRFYFGSRYGQRKRASFALPRLVG